MAWWHTVPRRPPYKSGRGPEIDFQQNPRYGNLVPRLVLIFPKLSEWKVTFSAFLEKSFPLRLLGSKFSLFYTLSRKVTSVG